MSAWLARLNGRELTWLSRKGCTKDWAAPAARQASRSYDPTGSKEYTAPVPEEKGNEHVG